jgi:hypothetical protein
MVRGALLAAAMVIGLAGRAIAADPPAEGEVRAALERARARSGTQRELPPPVDDKPVEGEGDAPKGKPGELTPADDGMQGGAPSPFWQLVSRVFLWSLIGGAALLVITWVVTELSRRRGRTATADTLAVVPDAGVRVASPLADPAALAAEGRWDEAVHALLATSLALLAARAPISDSLTGRELVAQVSMPAPARTALSALVGHVERSLFGGSPADREIFERAARDHESFRAALAGS